MKTKKQEAPVGEYFGVFDANGDMMGAYPTEERAHVASVVWNHIFEQY